MAAVGPAPRLSEVRPIAGWLSPDGGNGEDSKSLTAHAEPTRFRAQFMKSQMCRYYRTGCLRGDQCDFAHGPQELQVAPDLSKTSLCKAWQRGQCTLDASACSFAHGSDDLRVTRAYLKSAPCRLFFQGRCDLGNKCRHAHNISEVRASRDLLTHQRRHFEQLHKRRQQSGQQQQHNFQSQLPQRPRGSIGVFRGGRNSSGLIDKFGQSADNYEQEFYDLVDASGADQGGSLKQWAAGVPWPSSVTPSEDLPSSDADDPRSSPPPTQPPLPRRLLSRLPSQAAGRLNGDADSSTVSSLEAHPQDCLVERDEVTQGSAPMAVDKFPKQKPNDVQDNVLTF